MNDPYEDEVLALRSDARSLSDRAQAFLMAGRGAEAILMVNQLVRDHPDFPQTWLPLGRAQNLLNQPVATLKRDLGPALNLGFALAKSGKPREAVPAFEEGIRQNPEMIDAYILLADLHVQLGQKSKATQLANLAERLNPADPRLPVLRKKIQP